MRTKPPEELELTDLQRLRVTERYLSNAELALKRECIKSERLKMQLGKIQEDHNRLFERYHETLQKSREKEKANATLLLELDSANKQLAWFRKQYFGQKTEANLPLDTEHDDGDDEPEDPIEQAEPKRKRGQQKGAKGHGRGDRSNLPEEDPEVIDLPSTCCPDCKKPYSEFPETEDSSIVEFETRIYKRKIKRKQYGTRCDCAPRTIITAPPPAKLYKKTTIGNTLWVHLLVQRMLQGMPLNRILKDLALKGLGLSAGTVTGGFKIINTLVEPVYEQLQLECAAETMWNADETSWRVFEDEQGLRSSKKWWLWVFAGQRSVVYVLDRSRSSAVPIEFFGGSEGTLISDRFSAYKKKTWPDTISKAWCWVHVRRDFVKVFEGTPKLKNWARQWLLDIAQLFVLNHKRFDLWSRQQNFGREWHSANVNLAEHVDHLQRNWQTQLRTAVHEQQKTILNSLKQHWKGLTLFLNDPCIPLDNNRAERLLRNCVFHRKTSYGNGSEWSGQLSARFFSIFQTWLINGLDPEKMLLEYFNECSLTPGLPPQSIEKFLPWKMEKEKLLEFALPSSYKRPG
jgi:transposase